MGANENQETQYTFSREVFMLTRKAIRLPGGLLPLPARTIYSTQ
jgi:hypothetical protein